MNKVFRRIGAWWRKLEEREPHVSDLEGRVLYVSRFDDDDISAECCDWFGEVVATWLQAEWVFIGFRGELVWLRLEADEALRLAVEGKLSKRQGSVIYEYRIDTL